MPKLLLSAVAALVTGLSWAAPANAAWFKAETERFVVYGTGFEQSVRDYAVKLQTFDAVLRLYHPSTVNRKSETKVQVFLVNRREDLRRVVPRLTADTAGVYMATNEGIFALALNNDVLGKDDTLFHEYAHHFMLENFPVAYPVWFVEGFAEYFMTTEIKGDRITVGGYNPNRAAYIFNVPWLPLDDLLSKPAYTLSATDRSMFYAQAWLLTHYMRSDPERAKKLDKAISDTAQGKDPLTAFKEAVGGAANLTTDLRRYRRLPTTVMTGLKLEHAVKSSALPASADDLLLDNLRLILSETGRTDQAFLDGVRRKAARYPDDAFARATLARAEFVMGDVAKGEAILDDLLKASPTDPELLLQAGTSQVLAGIRNSAERDARFKAAKPFLIKAYQGDTGDFRPLYMYEFARSVEPGFPNDNDVNNLTEARFLAPAVKELSLRLGVALIAKNRLPEARRVLSPLMNDPHSRATSVRVRALLEGKSEAEADKAAEGEEDEEASGPNSVAGR